MTEFFRNPLCPWRVISSEHWEDLRRLGMKTTAGNKKSSRGSVYCLICTHTVEVDVFPSGRKTFVRSGQKCPRCSSSLDAAYVLAISRST